MLLPLLCVLDVVLLTVGCWLVWRLPWRGPLGEWAPWIAFGLTSSLVMALVVAPWCHPFGALRAACHALFCVFLPTYGCRGLRLLRVQEPAGCRRWFTARRHAVGCLLTVLAAEACYVWALEVEPFRLEITRARITSPRLRDLDRPLRIAAIADLQPETIGAYEISVFDALVAEAPDVVVFLGDTLCRYAPTFHAQRELLHVQLARLHPRLGMLAVDGDADGAAAEDIFAGSAVQVLTHGHRELPGLPIDVLGLSRGRSRRTALDVGLVRHLQGERFCIVLGHAPDYMRSVLDGGLHSDALFLAGHTHGGQVQVPGFGPLITLSSVPRWLAAGGVFRRGDTWLAVSRGIGMERDDAPRIRFWCRPQLLLLELAAP
jgi:predicted MPP superfamily phosphohydrolase